MSDLRKLARMKVDAEMQRRLATFPKAIEALKNELYATSSPHSGVLLKRVLALFRSAFDEQRATVIREYRWAVATALFAPQSWVTQLTSDAIQSLEPLHIEAEKQFSKASVFAGKPDLLAHLLQELQPTEAAAASDISLALQSAFAERSRGLVKGAPALFSRLIAKLLGGGAG